MSVFPQGCQLPALIYPSVKLKGQFHIHSLCVAFACSFAKLLTMFTQTFSLLFSSCISKFHSNGIHALFSSYSVPSLNISKCCLCFGTGVSQVSSHVVIRVRTISVGEAQSTPTASLQPRLLPGVRWKLKQPSPAHPCKKSNHKHC